MRRLHYTSLHCIDNHAKFVTHNFVMLVLCLAVQINRNDLNNIRGRKFVQILLKSCYTSWRLVSDSHFLGYKDSTKFFGYKISGFTLHQVDQVAISLLRTHLQGRSEPLMNGGGGGGANEKFPNSLE